MRVLVAIWRLGRMLVHVLHGLLIVHLRWSRMAVPARQRMVRWWSAKLLRVLGVSLQVQGHGRPGPKLLAANHVSWLDIAAMHAVLPEARFVSKAAIRHWPLVGAMVEAVGTLFIEREQARRPAGGASDGRRAAGRRHGGGLPRGHDRARLALAARAWQSAAVCHQYRAAVATGGAALTSAWSAL